MGLSSADPTCVAVIDNRTYRFRYLSVTLLLTSRSYWYRETEIDIPERSSHTAADVRMGS